MEYVTPEYQKQLDELAEKLMADRRAKLAEQTGQIALFEVQHGNPA